MDFKIEINMTTVLQIVSSQKAKGLSNVQTNRVWKYILKLEEESLRKLNKVVTYKNCISNNQFPDAKISNIPSSLKTIFNLLETLSNFPLYFIGKKRIVHYKNILMGQKLSEDNLRKQKIANNFEGRVEEFIDFINKRKRETSKMLQLVNTGPEDWICETRNLLAKHAKTEHDTYIITTITTLYDYLGNLEASYYLKSFSNKIYLEQLNRIEQQPYSRKQLANTKVSQERIETLLQLFFQQNCRQQSDGSKNIFFQQETIQEQMVESRTEMKKKDFAAKMQFIEKEINQPEHIIVSTLEKFIIILKEKYLATIQESTQNYLNQQFEQAQSIINADLISQKMISECKFIITLISEMIQLFYQEILTSQNKQEKQKKKKDDLFTITIIKSLFKNQDFYEMIWQITKIENVVNLLKLEKSMENLKFKRLEDFNIIEMFRLDKDPNPYSNLMKHFKCIQKAICPVKKFELIGQVKEIICQCIDEYYDEFSQPEISKKQKSIDCDTFLSIIIYCIIQLRDRELYGQIKLIEFVLPQKISYDYGEASWVWITFCTAMEYLLQNAVDRERKDSVFDDLVNSVLRAQLGQERKSSMHLF